MHPWRHWSPASRCGRMGLGGLRLIGGARRCLRTLRLECQHWRGCSHDGGGGGIDMPESAISTLTMEGGGDDATTSVASLPTVAEPPKINCIIALTIIAKTTLIQLARTSAVPRVNSQLKPRKLGSNKQTSYEGESREYNNMHFIHHRVLQRNLKLLQTSSESKNSSTTEVLSTTVHQSSFIQRKVKSTILMLT
jgi:hypothetical protein